MSDLVVIRIKKDATDDELSGLTAQSDVVLIFPSSSLASPLGISLNFSSVILQEKDLFLKLVCH
uniref:DUF7780 domain-containing protein n=1 Tax=Nelumbo nucifera TaxID=4432 RepID=A0A822XPT6_NELNU|nr:TPA_asm: hypothetical protein HUJ06_022664 [Nelumbo nucifera]